jgi:DNA transformation protein
MDRDYLIDLFSEFGPIALRRMFSGYGIVADDVKFAMALRAGLIFRVDDLTVGRYDAEGAKPFQYETRRRTVVVTSYRYLPERLYDDPEELAVWAREAVEAARRAAAKKSRKRAGGHRSAAKKAAPLTKKPGIAKSEAAKSRVSKSKATKARPSAAKRSAAKAGSRTTAVRKNRRAKGQAT